ncbi:TAXI family TRAP transporter solute-binding subunit [Pseudaquabacterium rugosum]|uniref:TAXI family TRAP transporter solute-binding subunit n=1 Tax=Pseudaquabacterium rugosum TaxID=2984194 RepID=A0ABU9BCC7_9BURK
MSSSPPAPAGAPLTDAAAPIRPTLRRRLNWPRWRPAWRELLSTAAPFVLLTVALLGVAYWLLDPAPPRRLVLATGPERSAYAVFGERYVQILRRQGIEVVLRPTQGSAENLARLRQPHTPADGPADQASVDVAFVNGSLLADESDEGTDGGAPAPSASDSDAESLRSLGQLFREPIWVFYRSDRQTLAPGMAAAAAELAASVGAPAAASTPQQRRVAARRAKALPVSTHALQPAPQPPQKLSDLAGWRINIGAAGGGLAPLARELLAAHQLQPAQLRLSQQQDNDAVAALLGGELDAVMLASAPEGLLVQMLLRTPGIALMDFVQADAYARRWPFIAPVRLPRGIVDLAADLPPADRQLLAPTTLLVARADTHPALQQLLVQAAHEAHAGAGWFQRPGEFPQLTAGSTLPLSPEAERHARNGTPWLQRYLPFGLANLFDRMWVALASIIVVAIPLSRIIPPLYQFRIRSRVFRWYAQLRAVEDAIGQRPADELSAELDAIDARVLQISVPLSYAEELYALRSHIAWVRQRVQLAASLSPSSEKS